MMEKIKKHTTKILIFTINLLLMVIGVLIVKDKDENRIAMETEKTSEINSVDAEILDTQRQISAQREDNLRSLNSSAKEIKQKQTTTTTTKTSPASAPVKTAPKKANKQTKTS